MIYRFIRSFAISILINTKVSYLPTPQTNWFEFAEYQDNFNFTFIKFNYKRVKKNRLN